MGCYKGAKTPAGPGRPAGARESRGQMGRSPGDRAYRDLLDWDRPAVIRWVM